MTTNHARRLGRLEAIWTVYRTPEMQRVIGILAGELGCDPIALRAEAESLAATYGMNEPIETVAERLASEFGISADELIAEAERIAALDGKGRAA